jgi:hypothetical protein
MAAGLRARVRHALDWRHRAVIDRLDAIASAVTALDARVASLDARVAALDDRAAAIETVLRSVAIDEAGTRRRLYAARSSQDYAAAFEAPDLLVSVVIPAYGSPRLLVSRAIPSALAQTWPNVEVVVVSDGPDDAIRAAVESVGDARVRFAATTHRVVNPDPSRHWLVASALPRNHGWQLARGAWVADLDQDDALRPDAVERLLELARRERAEVVYGPIEEHHPGGATRRLESFPPRMGEFGWQGSLVHAGLRCFERELFAAAYGLPGDIFRAERMLRAGVRFAFEPGVTCDYFPSTLWLERGEDGVADAIDVPGGHAQVQREREQ